MDSRDRCPDCGDVDHHGCRSKPICPGCAEYEKDCTCDGDIGDTADLIRRSTAALRAEVESLRTQLAAAKQNYADLWASSFQQLDACKADLAVARSDLSEACSVAAGLAVHLKALCYHADNFEHRYEGSGRACAGCYDALIAYEAWA